MLLVQFNKQNLQVSEFSKLPYGTTLQDRAKIKWFISFTVSQRMRWHLYKGHHLHVIVKFWGHQDHPLYAGVPYIHRLIEQVRTVYHYLPSPVWMMRRIVTYLEIHSPNDSGGKSCGRRILWLFCRAEKDMHGNQKWGLLSLTKRWLSWCCTQIEQNFSLTDTANCSQLSESICSRFSTGYLPGLWLPLCTKKSHNLAQSTCTHHPYSALITSQHFRSCILDSSLNSSLAYIVILSFR